MAVVAEKSDHGARPDPKAVKAVFSLVLKSRDQDLKAAAKGAVSLLPEPFQEGARRAKEMLKGMAVGGTLFEELGFSYVGPIDGHNLDHLLPILKNVRDSETGPILVHVVTQKGKGYAPAEAAADKYHGVTTFDVITGTQAI